MTPDSSPFNTNKNTQMKLFDKLDLEMFMIGYQQCCLPFLNDL